MKKIILVLITLLCLFGCTTNNTVPSAKIIAGDREDGKYDEFNTYLFNELGLAYTPTFIIINKDNKIVYFNDGEVTASEFKNLLKSIEDGSVDLPEEYKNNLGKEFMNVDFVQKDKMNVIEIVWTNCSHCKVQVNENNPEIFKENPTINFVEYFALDSQEAIEDFLK